MRLPVCGRCAESQILCPECEGKLSAGAINEFDVEVSRTLYELFGDSACFTRAFDTADHVIVLTEQDEVGNLIGREGVNARTIMERVGKPVKVVSESEFDETVKAFIAPARVKSINTVHRPGGESIRVRVEAGDRRRLRMNVEDLRALVSGLTDSQVELVFD